MNRNDFGLVKNFTAAGAVKPNRVVAFGTDEDTIETAVSPTAKAFVGVTGILGSAAAGERLDAYLDGVHNLEAGAVFGQGVQLTVDNQGRVIAAAPAATVTHQVIGKSLGRSTAVGELVPVHILPGTFTNAANS